MKVIPAFFGSIMVALLAIGVANAGSFEDAITAYERGDYTTAFKTFMLAAEDGNADAQVNIGAMYANGEGIDQNLDEAIRWYRLSAEQGNAAAQNKLGAMYDDGMGVSQNFEEAANWYRRSAEQGNVGAQINLGVMHAKGVGVQQDYVLAHMWLSIAASHIGAEAAEMRAFVARLRDRIAIRMTRIQIEEARQLASGWKPKVERQAAHMQ